MNNESKTGLGSFMVWTFITMSWTNYVLVPALRSAWALITATSYLLCFLTIIIDVVLILLTINAGKKI